MLKIVATSLALPLLVGCSATPGAIRKEFLYEATIQGRPEVVFPLLCPVRETEWIEGWKADRLFTRSGVAEDNAIFRTHLVLGETWVTTRYEPERFRVEYTIFAGGHAVMRMDLSLLDNRDGSSRWITRRTYTGLDWLGRRTVKKTDQKKVDAEQALLERQLNHFLQTGAILKRGSAMAAPSQGPAGWG